MKLSHNYYFIVYCIFFSYSLMMSMEDKNAQKSFQGIKSLQKHCCVAVAHFETSDIQKIIKKLKLPHTNLRSIADEVSLIKSPEDCISIFGMLPTTLYTGIALTLLCNTTNDNKPRTKKILRYLWEQDNVSEHDQRILTFFNFYLDISEKERITKEKILQKSLGHKTTSLFVSKFLLQEGAKVSENPIEEIIENRIENEYAMQQPEFITKFLQQEEIIVMCQRSIDMINKSLPNNQSCDEESVRYSCVYAAYNCLFLNTIKKLIKLGFVPNKEGFIPKRLLIENKNNKISVFEFIVQNMQDWKNNYALRNTAYAKYMLNVWDTPEAHDMNVLYDIAITRYYQENPSEFKKVDILRSMGTPTYKKKLNAFLTTKHYFHIFSYEALKCLKQFYPEEFKLLEARIKRNE